MEHIRINDLKKLNSDYCAGSSNNILYKCSLLGPFVLHTAKTDYPELDIKDIYNAYMEWLDICDAGQIELIDSLIELYSHYTINNVKLRFFEEYTSLFETMVCYLLGKINWTPPTEQHLAAVSYSNSLTAQVLSNIYSNS